jgi:hypothetical protein
LPLGLSLEHGYKGKESEHSSHRGIMSNISTAWPSV